MSTTLSLSGKQHEMLRTHLFPGDGLEAVAVALCGRYANANEHRLLVQRIILIPYESCIREPNRLTWSTDLLIPLLEEASRGNLALLKIHSHPGGYPKFSQVDDMADRELFPSAYSWNDSEAPHASAIMLPDGQIFGRVVDSSGGFRPLTRVRVTGEDLCFWDADESMPDLAAADLRNVQAFGRGTVNRLKRLKIAVVGCSGTGSPVVEQLARLGVGSLLLVDPDVVEEKNLNRIVNATREDALRGVPKVKVLARAIEAMGLGTRVEGIQKSLLGVDVLNAIAGCDIVFGCVDSVEARHVLNRLCTFYLLPYFDIGVSLDADGVGGVEQVSGAVHYIQPGGSSLLSRGMYSLDQVKSEYMKRTDPAYFEEQVRAKYLAGVREERPAVVSVNLMFSALAVNELLARLHPYRSEDNSAFAVHCFSLSGGFNYHAEDGLPCEMLIRHVGRGNIVPMLDMPTLDDQRSSAA